MVQEVAEDLLDGEIWRPTPSFEGWYDVSNLGRVRRAIEGRGTNAGRILSPFFTGRKKTGQYLAVVLTDGQDRRMIAVHLLVAAAFIGPRPEGYHTNHKDANKVNNRVDNLEYLTPADHGKHTAQMGLVRVGVRRWNRDHPERRARGDHNGTRLRPETRPRGESVNTAKLTAEQVREIRQYSKEGMLQVELARRFGVNYSNVSAIVNRKTWKHI